jgi:Flp pilus assembly pilin Flp
MTGKQTPAFQSSTQPIRHLLCSEGNAVAIEHAVIASCNSNVIVWTVTALGAKRQRCNGFEVSVIGGWPALPLPGRRRRSCS